MPIELLSGTYLNLVKSNTCLRLVFIRPCLTLPSTRPHVSASPQKMEMEYVPCWGRVLARRWHRDPHPDRAYFILFPLRMIRSYPFRDFKTANSRYFSQFTMESFSLYFHRIILFSFLQLLPFLHVFVLFLFFPSYSLFHNLKNSQLKEWGELLLDFYWKHQMTSPPSPLLGVASTAPQHCSGPVAAQGLTK